MKLFAVIAAMAAWLGGCATEDYDSRGGMSNDSYLDKGYESEMRHDVDSPGTRDPRLPASVERDFPGRPGPGELKQ